MKFIHLLLSNLIGQDVQAMRLAADVGSLYIISVLGGISKLIFSTSNVIMTGGLACDVNI